MPIRLHVLASAARHAVSSSVLVCRLIAFHLTPLLLHLSYFLAVDLLGSLALVLLKPSKPGYHPRYVDVFFMSTSAVTVTGLATVEMEDLSSAQLVVLTLLMLLGSEMFVSLLGLVLESSRKRRQQQRDHQDHDGRVMAAAVCDEPGPDLEEANGPAAAPSADSSGDGGDRKESCRSVRTLALVVSAYMAAILVVGSVLVFAYVATVPTARDVLARKRINAALFSVSTTVSSFTNGGLLPTNESMAVFAANRGLLLLLAAQILAGSTLLPVFLRLVVGATRGLARALFLFTGRGGPVEELVPMDMEKSAAAAGFGHLLPSGPRAASLAATVVAVAAAAAALGGDERAQLALAMFARRAAAGIAAVASALPVLDALVFTGGIGEHAALVRAAICARLATLGVPAVPGEPDDGDDRVLSERGAAVAVLRVSAREDLVIARETARLVGG